ncbi:MAG: Flp pilus assembly complex ATPase component TadA [Nitrospiraceae bacterium]|nr:MAG: Flp pilus assembly complex ATPase component TadA [Nitrospiraceae bacterium]
MKKKRIGEILTDEGLITVEQLDNALLLQKAKNKRLGKVLAELGYVTAIQIAETISKQLAIPLVDCSRYSPSKQILSLIPRETAETKLIFPLEHVNNRLVVAMADPLDFRTIDDLSFQTGMKMNIAVASENNILNAIEQNYGSSEVTWDVLKEIPSYGEVEFVKEEVKTDDKQSISFQALFKDSEAPPIVKLVTMIIADAVNYKASDIHIEPRDKHVQVRYRIDGELKNVLSFPSRIKDSVISRVKIIANMDITNRRFPQDGRSALRLKDKTVDLRISTLPSVHGENIVIRLLDPSTGLIALSKLGISEKIIKPLIEVISQPQGMLLITGPTGSGKTTTLYSILQQLRTETKNIITIEDPVEYKVPDITQVGINDAIGFSFANALRSVLRQDPDIVMVGEIRDLDTAEIGARSALTGHLVLSTLHTNDTVSSITRLLDIGLESFLVTSAVTAVIAQRLVRKICLHCRIETTANGETVNLPVTPLKTYYKGEGCQKCNHTGYSGRVGVYELLRMDTPLRRLIARKFTEGELWEVARASGTKTLFEDGWEKVAEGITTIDEFISKIPCPEVLHNNPDKRASRFRKKRESGESVLK